ncbi:Multistep phosphorelay regulator 1 [Neolecta irregularis DAH-3]|uniref:Multistep phosphorelay regulator 1 n=1 Tax=Neolecta irregularis (strain DAH-3) TaxID=1198029 RepID=A0A1U7LH01_NEOID|nr:Multistep phosphorelay regulator 1 [Neolecta irregularis DAH-3]|eukprot:OLL21935.1 Multistep phosphorelay regulator 1 [Neolecta irregularis DAH-3]
MPAPPRPATASSTAASASKDPPSSSHSIASTHGHFDHDKDTDHDKVKDKEKDIVKVKDKDTDTDTDTDHEHDFMDRSIFDQLLEMDDDGEREFSKGIVWHYFDQAEDTFHKIQAALEKADLNTLGSLGHFLKGSSAALGLTKVKASCERIQNFGAGKDETGAHSVNDPDLCLRRIKDTLEQVRLEYRQAEIWLKKFYKDE